MTETVRISGIQLTTPQVGKLTFSIEEAKQLYEQLRDLLGEKQIPSSRIFPNLGNPYPPSHPFYERPYYAEPHVPAPFEITCQSSQEPTA